MSQEEGRLKLGRFTLVTHRDNTTQSGELTDISEFGVTVCVREPGTLSLLGVFFSHWDTVKNVNQTPGECYK